jgi:DNA-binding transcriptional LysR family regulator
LTTVKKRFVFSDNFWFSVKLSQIQTLIAIAESGSIRAAARRLQLTQPALSKGLQALEEELSVPLVHRTARGVTLTPYGRAIVTRGRGIALEFDRLRDEVEQMRGAQGGRVLLAVAPSPAVLLLPNVLKRFHAEQPGIVVHVRESIFPDTLQWLREGQADIAVGAHPPSRKGAVSEFTTEKLYNNRLVVTARQGHPKANARSLADLLDCDWLLHGPTEGPGSLYAPVFRAHGLTPPNPRVISDSFISTLSLLERSDALSLLPEMLIRHYTKAGRLTQLPLSETMPHWDVSLITRAQTPLTPMAQKMVEAFRRTAISTA